MTRTDAIARINAKLAVLDDERVSAVAEIVDGIAADTASMRALTEHELRLLEQSKEHFRQGRKLTKEAYHADMRAFMADLETRHATKS